MPDEQKPEQMRPSSPLTFKELLYYSPSRFFNQVMVRLRLNKPYSTILPGGPDQVTKKNALGNLLLGSLPVKLLYFSLTEFKWKIGWCYLSELKEESKNHPLTRVYGLLKKEEREGVIGEEGYSDEEWTTHIGEGNYITHSMSDKTMALPFEEMRKIVEDIHKARLRGESVLVHCKAGKGRSWTVIACYLCTQDCFYDPDIKKYRPMSYDEAVAWIKRCRPEVNPAKGQPEYVQQFITWYQRLSLVHEPVDEDIPQVREEPDGVPHNGPTQHLALSIHTNYHSSSCRAEMQTEEPLKPSVPDSSHRPRART